MSRPRILEFSTYAKIGGTQKMLLEFLRHASHTRYEYTLCVLLAHDRLNDEVAKLGLAQTSLNMRGYWDLSAWWKLYQFVKRRHFDLIRTYGLKADLIGRVVGKLAGIPVNITSVRSTDPWRQWYHVWLDMLTSRWTDLYLSNSEAGRLAVHQRERIPLAKIVTIPNGVDLETYDRVKLARSEIVARYRRDLGLSPTTPVLGIIANLCKMKGHTTLVDALPCIQQEFPNVRCLFIGTDFLQGGIQEYIRASYQEKSVICTGFRQDIPELLALIDIVLLPSLWEGLPTALLEAMAVQKPIVATAVGGIPELIESGRTGLLIAPQDSEALAQAIIFLLQHPDVAAQMGQAGYETVRQHFSIDGMVAQTEAIYTQLISHEALD